MPLIPLPQPYRKTEFEHTMTRNRKALSKMSASTPNQNRTMAAKMGAALLVAGTGRNSETMSGSSSEYACDEGARCGFANGALHCGQASVAALMWSGTGITLLQPEQCTIRSIVPLPRKSGLHASLPYGTGRAKNQQENEERRRERDTDERHRSYDGEASVHHPPYRNGLSACFAHQRHGSRDDGDRYRQAKEWREGSLLCCHRERRD